MGATRDYSLENVNEIQPNSIIGNYIFLEKIAIGGMAEVWLARTTSGQGLDKFVAIKTVLPHLNYDSEHLQMFKKEASIVMNLTHANIASVFEFFTRNSEAFLVMEFVDGRNLNEVINKLDLEGFLFATEHIVYIIKEVAAALDHAHKSVGLQSGQSLGVVHRDVSPSNILLGFNGEVKLIDFGVAKAISQIHKTVTGTFMGKLCYMSPEQARGENLDLRTDIFSLGICMWEMFADRSLFKGDTPIHTLENVKRCEIPDLKKINPNVPDEVCRITYKALSPSRDNRYASAAEMHKDLSVFLNQNYAEFTLQQMTVGIKKVFETEIKIMQQKLKHFLSDTNQSHKTQVINISLIEQSFKKPERNSRENVFLKSISLKLSDIQLYPDSPQGRKFPKKLALLFVLFLISVFNYSLDYHDILLESMPDKLKPEFLEIVGPFIDVNQGVSGRAVKVDVQNQEDNKRYVQIDRQYYEYNSSGVYVVNGKKIFYKNERK